MKAPTSTVKSCLVARAKAKNWRADGSTSSTQGPTLWAAAGRHTSTPHNHVADLLDNEQPTVLADFQGAGLLHLTGEVQQ